MKRVLATILLIVFTLFLVANLPQFTNIIFLDLLLVEEPSEIGTSVVKEQKEIFFHIFKDTPQENVIFFLELLSEEDSGIEKPLGSEEVEKLRKVMFINAFKSTYQEVMDYFKGIPSGESFLYDPVDPFDKVNETRNFLDEIPPLFLFSTINVSMAGVLALILGILVGLWLATSHPWVKDLFSFISVVPDFAAALILQLLVVGMYQLSGILFAEVASTNADTAILLPFITMTYMPFMYVVRMVSYHAYQVLTEDYILTAKSKGLKKWYIYSQHVLRNVIPFIKADLHKTCSLMLGNLLLIEYLFNQPGISTLLFHGTAPFPLAFNTLLCLMLVYLITYFCMSLTIMGLKRGFAYE